jgi:hypothetical protein
MNSTMVTISWIVTVIFAILLLISWSSAAKIQTPYGSPASSLPYILGMIIGNGLIPGILWLITYFTAPKINETGNKDNSDTLIINSKTPSFTNINSIENTNIYYIQENGSTSEPLTYNQLCAKKINKDTYVWRKGVDWIKAGELKELKELFQQNGPPPFSEPKPDPDFMDKYHNEILFVLIFVVVALIIYLVVRVKQDQSTSVAFKSASNIAAMIV